MIPDNYAMFLIHEHSIENKRHSLTCDMCGRGIIEGEDYFDFDERIVCEDCLDDYIDNFRKVASD